MSLYANEYKQFLESPAGLQFMEVIKNGLNDNHRKAEDSESSDVAYGYSKTAKAYRGILNHITSVTGEKID